MNHFIEQLLIGIQLGSIYALIALGYTMVYGVLKLINFAHGDVYMVGAYAGLSITMMVGTWLPSHGPLAGFNVSPVGSVLVMIAAMVICGALGYIIELAAYRPLRSNSWIAPSIFIGGASAYITYCIVMSVHGYKGPAIAAALMCWAAITLIIRRSQLHRSQQVSTRLSALITAIGVSLFLENFGVLPQIFSADPQFYPSYKWMIDPVKHTAINIHLGGVSINIVTITMFSVSLVLMLILTYIVTRTKIGKAIRAVSFDRDAAELMGIDTNKVISFTFVLGAALAGAAGVLVMALQGTSFNPYSGVQPGIKAFVAAVLGGIGNIPGATLGGLIMGIAETMTMTYGHYIHVPDTYRDAVAFFILIVILLFRPSGLLGKFEPEKV